MLGALDFNCKLMLGPISSIGVALPHTPPRVGAICTGYALFLSEAIKCRSYSNFCLICLIFSEHIIFSWHNKYNLVRASPRVCQILMANLEFCQLLKRYAK
jgi:hypothetical protein